MSYLDDLRKQAQVIREERQGSTSQSQQEAAVERALQLSLRLIYGYLRELVEQLNVVKPDLSVSYYIDGYGRLTGLSQGDYTLRIDDLRAVTDLALSFVCAHGDAQPRLLRVADRAGFLRQRDYLWRHGLKFDSKLAVGGEGTFLLEPIVPVSLHFSPDSKTRRIKFLIKNLDRLGEETFLIDPLGLKRERLDGITGLVLRKSNSLVKLTGPLITDDAKRRIRQALAEEREQQLRHEAKAAAISLAQQEAEAQKRLPAKMRRAISMAMGHLTAIISRQWDGLRPYTKTAYQWGAEKLRYIGSRVYTGLPTRRFR